jgi:hypothetical protein
LKNPLKISLLITNCQFPKHICIRYVIISISYWFEIKDITFFFKCKVGYFDLKLEDYVVQPPHHQTRFSSANTLRPNLCRTSFFRNFYFNRVVLMWNNLPSTIKSSLTFSSLKCKLYHYYYEKLNLDFNLMSIDQELGNLCVQRVAPLTLLVVRKRVNCNN